MAQKQKDIIKSLSRKEFNLEVKNLQDDGTFQGYLSVFGNVDLQGDKIKKGAFSESIKGREKFPLLWQHDPSSPIGVFSAVEDDHGLKINSALNLETVKGKEAYALLKQGAVSGLSIGYEPVKYSWENSDIRVLEQVKLWEGSIVTFPANPQATVTTVKSTVPFQDLPLADIEREWDADRAKSRLRRWASGGSGDKDDMDWTKYRKAFLWYDENDQENFGSYKFPIADVVDGALKAVPRGIFAAAAVLQGARGGTDISEDDQAKMRRHLARYYAKLDRTPPWEETDSAESALYAVVGADIEGTLGKADPYMIEMAFKALNGVMADKLRQKAVEEALDNEIQKLKTLLEVR